MEEVLRRSLRSPDPRKGVDFRVNSPVYVSSEHKTVDRAPLWLSLPRFLRVFCRLFPVSRVKFYKPRTTFRVVTAITNIIPNEIIK